MSDRVGGIRGAEQRQLRQLILSGPQIRVVTVRGEAGIGKTTLVAGVAVAAAKAGWRVLRASGSTSEARLSHAGLHQLVRPLLSAVRDLPPAQRTAFNAALGLARGSASADLLQLYIACLALLSQQSDLAPLLLVVDDAQWIDHATLDILGFIARRLADDPIAMVFGSREAVAADLGPDSRTMNLSPLTALEANQLLDLQPLPPAGDARAAILGQAEGNPLGLVELARAVAADPAAAVSWRGRALTLTERLRQSFTASALMLSEQTHRALLLAAADDNTELNLSYLSGSLGVPADAWQPAQAAGLIAVSGGSATFSHPLIRSAIYQGASPQPAPPRTARWQRHYSSSPNGRPGSWPRPPPGPTKRSRNGWSQLPRRPARRAALRRRPRPGNALLSSVQIRTRRPSCWRWQPVPLGGPVRLTGRPPSPPGLSSDHRGSGSRPCSRNAWLGPQPDFPARQDRRPDERPGDRDRRGRLPGVGCRKPGGKRRFYSGEDALRGRVQAMLHTLNGGLPAWQAPKGSGAEVQATALWCGTALQPLTDRSAKLNAIRALTGQVSPEQHIPLAAAALLADDPRQAVMLRDQAAGTPELLGRGAALMVITWSLLETGQWDDALEYAGHARTLAAIYHEPVVRTSVITAAAYIAACRGHSGAAAEDAMSVLGISGLTARSSMTARANHAMGMAALVQDRNDEAFDWLRRLTADGGRAAHNREALFGLIDLAEAGRRTGRLAEASRSLKKASPARRTRLRGCSKSAHSAGPCSPTVRRPRRTSWRRSA